MPLVGINSNLWPKSRILEPQGEGVSDGSRSLELTPSNGGFELDQVRLWRHGRRNKHLKGLILAQNERWRRGLGMQVGGIPQGGTGVRGSKAWVPTFGFGIAIRDGG